jgi:uncharacterized protein YndB with AHSA1/START domain
MLMYYREVSIHIAAPPERVLDYVTDVARHGEWAANELVIRRDPGPDHGPGTRFTSQVKLMGQITAQGVVVEEDPPHRFVYEVEDSSGKWRWTMALQRDVQGTRLSHRFERLQAPLWVLLIQTWLLYPFVGWPAMQKGLTNICPGIDARLKLASFTYRI